MAYLTIRNNTQNSQPLQKNCWHPLVLGDFQKDIFRKKISFQMFMNSGPGEMVDDPPLALHVVLLLYCTCQLKLVYMI